MTGTATDVGRTALSDLYRAYVNMLEAARDRIIFLGGECDSVELMEAGDPALIAARASLASTDKIPLLVEALEFYADPFAWKEKHDPDDLVRIPDFYSELSFGGAAAEALAAAKGSASSRSTGEA